MIDEELKQEVRKHYAAIAGQGDSCCGPACGCGSATDPMSIAMEKEYSGADEQVLAAANLGLGCGTPVSFAGLKEGMTVLDLGAGAGIDVFLAAKAVGPRGRSIGIDMTDAMVSKARANRVKLGIQNAEFRRGELENLPVETETVDRVISNCVINLVPDKKKAFAEMYRVLKPGGTFAVSDIVSQGEIPDTVREDMDLWAGCISGAVEKETYLLWLRDAGFRDVQVVSERFYPSSPGIPFSVLSITVIGTK